MKHSREDYQGRIVDLAGKIPEDEPVLLFRAQDKHMVPVLQRYLDLLMADPNCHGDIRQAVHEHINRVLNWQAKHGSKTPDLPEPELTPDPGSIF